MRALIVLVVLAIAAPVFAEEAPSQAAPAKVEILPGRADHVPAPVVVEDERPQGGERPKPSGYWTGYRPARGGAYRWRLMGVAAVVLGLTVFFVVRTLRRASRVRLSR